MNGIILFRKEREHRRRSLVVIVRTMTSGGTPRTLSDA